MQERRDVVFFRDFSEVERLIGPVRLVRSSPPAWCAPVVAKWPPFAGVPSRAREIERERRWQEYRSRNCVPDDLGRVWAGMFFGCPGLGLATVARAYGIDRQTVAARVRRHLARLAARATLWRPPSLPRVGLPSRPIDMGGLRDTWQTWTPEANYAELSAHMR